MALRCFKTLARRMIVDGHQKGSRGVRSHLAILTLPVIALATPVAAVVPEKAISVIVKATTIRRVQRAVEMPHQDIMTRPWMMRQTQVLCSALPPPPFRADTPLRPNGAHIPAIDGQAATQIPARPVGAAGPDTPERPASNNKLQPGARAAADSPTPAPPAPPAPSPLFPSHSAYQSHAAAAMPDYRLTNHETRTGPPEQPPAPLDLIAHHAARPPPGAPASAQAAHPSLQSRVPHSQPHPLMPGHDVRNAATAAPAHTSVPTSYSNRVNGVPQSVPPHSLSTPPSNTSCLPIQSMPGRAISPAAPTSRPYPTPSIGSSHINTSMSSNIHGHPMPYQSQPSLQKHSVQSAYTNRPPHLAPFSVASHLTSSHIQSSTSSQTTVAQISHPLSSHSILNHTSHLSMSNSSPLMATSTPNHIGPPLSLSSTTSTISSYTTSLKHPGLSMPPHAAPLAPPASIHTPINHVETTPAVSIAPAIIPPVSSSSNSTHTLAPPVVDSRQPVVSSSELPSRTESPAVSSTLASNGFPPPVVYSGTTYPPLYAPYATTLQHSPYLPPAAASPRNTDTRTSLSASPLVAPKTPKGVRPHTPGSTGGAGSAPAHAPLSYSPRGHSPNRERESFSSNISSLSRSTSASAASAPAPQQSHAPALVAPLSAPLAAPLAAPLSSGLSAPLSSSLVPPLGAPLAAPTPTPAAPTPTHLTHSLAPVPTVPSISSSAKPPAHWGVTPAGPERSSSGFAPAPPLFGAPLAPPNPNPFSAESLFQSSPGADLLRRELDNRFLAAAGAAGGVRTELHHHQHQHTHVHQHPPHAPHQPHQPHPPHAPHAPHAPPPPHPHHQLLVPHAPLFKDMGKMPSLYRTGLGLGYPYSSSLLHPAAPYVPPAPLSSYAPKPVVSAASDSATKPPPRPATAKTGKWNAMHVRIAWEIYNHQQKEKSGTSTAPGAAADKEKLRAFPAPAPPPPAYRSPYDLPPAPYLHHPHLGVRYDERAGLVGAPPAPDRLRVSGVSPFGRYAPAFPAAPAFPLPYGRDLALSSSLHAVHHPPLPLHDAWRPRAPVSAAAAAEARREHEERERARRERDERERRDRDERERRKARERERDLERARTRSPLRNGAPEPERKDERKEPPRPPPALPAYAPPPWDPYRPFDPLQHMRFAPLVEAAIRAEEDRAKMLSAYAHHQQLKAGPLLHRGLHAGLPLAHGALSHAPLAPPLAPLAPLAPLDLLKKEEPR
ncbi:proline-rich protein 36-like isoform X3 [Ostrinia furnacalis]|uniref:proline-rich protein 36-like isoform X3 n=1 Tax=Ostrinia furnacalis TaxID=93504 RepID=UPI001040C920|nr:proline-rich protein 36-like isoform X3 [Ostrinia furnacalis]